MTTFPIAAITDEFSLDLDTALDAMAKIGMTGAELRLIGDRNGSALKELVRLRVAALNECAR